MLLGACLCVDAWNVASMLRGNCQVVSAPDISNLEKVY